MGYDGPDWNGNGGEVAGNVNRLLGRPNATLPTVGALMSRPGHVAVVEQVRTLPSGQMQFRVSEMNMAGGSTYEINHARAEEFQMSGWMNVAPGQTFAPFPG
jgi:hypothetical protein